jgi:hypothetical protein
MIDRLYAFLCWFGNSAMERKTLDFSFINQDVQTQLAQSKELVSIVQALEATLAQMPPSDQRAKIEATAKRLLGVASVLTSNATSTSSAAAITISSST